MSHATTNYMSFLSCIYSVGFLCQLLFDAMGQWSNYGGDLGGPGPLSSGSAPDVHYRLALAIRPP